MHHEKVTLQILVFLSLGLAISACAEIGELDASFADRHDTDLYEDTITKGGSARNFSRPFVNGIGGYHTYRTPSIIKAANGDLLAFAGARDAHGDNSRGNVVLRRSSDAGQTWEPMQTIAGKLNMKNRNGLASPVRLEDGTIILLYMWSKYVTSDEDRGCRKMYKRTSTDHGRTWSRRVDITSQTQKPCLEHEDGHIDSPIPDGNWGWTGLGPVHGIVKKFEPHAGRILFAARHKAPDGKSYAHLIYSDDNGQTWNIGGSLSIKSSEGTVVELRNGDVMLNARSTGNSTNRIVGRSSDGGSSFISTEVDDTLIEPGCQGSLLRYGSSILFSNPMSVSSKSNGTLRRSTDSGHTWAFDTTYLGPNRFSGYSDLVRKNGDIGVLVEWGPRANRRKPHEEIRYIVIPKEELGL